MTVQIQESHPSRLHPAAHYLGEPLHQLEAESLILLALGA
jgi:hypothetical protein